MASINLSQSNLDGGRDLNTIFDKNLVISATLIVLSFGSLFGLKMYNTSIEQKTTTLNTAIAGQLAELESDSVNRVVDFQERVTNIDTKLTKTDIAPQEMFAAVEKLMVSGASLDAYEYDTVGKLLTMKIVSGDFRVIAQQVMNFKSYGPFKNVIVNETSKKNDGVVISEVVISL